MSDQERSARELELEDENRRMLATIVEQLERICSLNDENDELRDKLNAFQEEIDSWGCDGSRTDLEEIQHLHKCWDDLCLSSAEKEFALSESLRWVLDEFERGPNEAPPHVCAFTVRPDIGHCEFHEKWADARALVPHPLMEDEEE